MGTENSTQTTKQKLIILLLWILLLLTTGTVIYTIHNVVYDTDNPYKTSTCPCEKK